jgi:hypothetical protein
MFTLLCEFCGVQLLRCDRGEYDRDALPKACQSALLAHWNAEPRCGAAAANYHGLRRNDPPRT